MNTRLLPVLLLGILLLTTSSTTLAQSASGPLLAQYEPSFGLLRDTVHVLDSTFLEVRLDEQMIYQHFRSGRTNRYTCSTGDPRIKDGIATREGIYSIQWKAKKHMSQQFQVYLNYWMPFDGGIGFHGLQGRSYYRYLGRRPSSHGCVRIANETGARIFGAAPRGTVVWVHSGSPARVVRFADSTMEHLRVMEELDGELLSARLDAVLERRADDSTLGAPIAIYPGRPFSGRIPVGRVERLHAAHRRLPLVDAARPTMKIETEQPSEPRMIMVRETSIEALLAEE
jgi:hypothetical protein